MTCPSLSARSRLGCLRVLSSESTIATSKTLDGIDRHRRIAWRRSSPSARVRVAESGLRTSADLARAARRRLRRVPHRRALHDRGRSGRRPGRVILRCARGAGDAGVTRIKICGMTTRGRRTDGRRGWRRRHRADLLVRQHAGAWTSQRAQAITRALPPLVSTRRRVRGRDAGSGRGPWPTPSGLAGVQLHGDEVVADWRGFRGRYSRRCRLEQYATSPWRTARAAILVDAHDPVTVGGTGTHHRLGARRARSR